MKTAIPFILLMIPFAAGCTNDSGPPAGSEFPAESGPPAESGSLTAQSIVDRAIEVHGGSAFDNSHITFDFRGINFDVWRKDGMFRYTRTYSDTSGQIVEIMSNEGFERTADGEPYEMNEREFLKYTEDVNSVIYFALLPYKLNDPPVKHDLRGTKTIEGRPYYEIAVSFEQEGGGRDWDDQFVYWFNVETGTMDYLAYYYTQRGTARFRKAQNIRTIGGIRFADYLNFRADTMGVDVANASVAFDAGELDLLSEILTENVSVSPAE